ncbi:hypothetical protein Cni_G25007 [Canna indica]|uniref:Uncharacterized protein n=1 Tax=Canna indica TaxID=4628 RepID=A0AAQ3KX38_9LILI|nr:hypothetical protein Cni_G25007 [Canna indica]
MVYPIRFEPLVWIRIFLSAKELGSNKSDPLASTAISAFFKIQNFETSSKSVVPYAAFLSVVPIPEGGAHKTLELGASCREIRSSDEDEASY